MTSTDPLDSPDDESFRTAVEIVFLAMDKNFCEYVQHTNHVEDLSVCKSNNDHLTLMCRAATLM